jgi:predicted ATP-binding protein involved in virulence
MGGQSQMRIKHVKIEDFRLLRQLVILLEERTTLIVGRNDCGKMAVYLNPKRGAGKQTMVQQ